MGSDAVNYCPVGTTVREVGELLKSLGYTRQRRNPFFAYYLVPTRDDLTTGVGATISQLPDGRIGVTTHTSIWRSRGDSDLHNATIRAIKKRFGGGFASDNGPNAYLTCWRPHRADSEASAYKAYATFESNLERFDFTIQGFAVTAPQLPPGFDALDPRTNLSHALLPFLTSIAEEYLRSTYVGLLRHSPRKEQVLRTARTLTGEDLASISDGRTSVERAVAQSMGFQTLDRVVHAFHDLDSALDVSAPLKRPYRRRQVSLYDSLSALFERRHAFIHRLETDPTYTLDRLKRDRADLGVCINRLYEYLVQTYGWSEYDL